ncbi:hypothetical protein A5N15_02365 [Rothia kristinae]|uniref:Uncharacterized protein n=1 Tax=Rothia kristinae TaxID=37923 RepID=A0A657IW28_9MICC|nr:hypothetical protein A5N15_02365 [Rothia kristinae]
MIAAALGRRLLEGLEVHPEPMARNLALTFPEAPDTDPEDTGTYGDAWPWPGRRRRGATASHRMSRDREHAMSTRP